MSFQLIVILGIGLITILGGGAFFFFSSSGGGLGGLMGGKTGQGKSEEDISMQEREFRRAKEILAKKKTKKKKKITLEEKFFQAGMFTSVDRKGFYRLKTLAPIIGAIVLAYGGSLVDVKYAFVGGIFGLLVGMQVPVSVLDRKILARGEDIMYYLPLVIEQIAIGVSSSLDIGPCLQKVVSMADERDSHNVASELLRIVVTLARSGISLEDALVEVGKRSGHLELKQTFNAMAQVTRHGGEITKQLQELADAVSSQRETRIEAKIKKLELEATGPVAMVFLGFMLILLTTVGLQMVKAFN